MSNIYESIAARIIYLYGFFRVEKVTVSMLLAMGSLRSWQLR